MRFHVLGLGSIGSLLSYHLRRSLPEHHNITLIYRTQRQAEQNGSEIRFEVNGVISKAAGFKREAFDSPIYPQTSHSGSGSDEDDSRKIDSLFVATKAHQTLPAIRQLSSRLSPESTIVLLQNGMGVYEELTQHIFSNPATRPHFILASITHGVFRKKKNHFVHTGLGGISFGIVPDPQGRNFEAGFQDQSLPPWERLPRLSDISADSESNKTYKSLQATVATLLLLESLNVSWRPVADVQTVMYQKLVVNAVINPLTALMGCRNGDILCTTTSQRIARKVCQEASQVFRAQFAADARSWIKSLEDSGHDTKNLPLQRVPHVLTKMMLEKEVIRVARLTGGNISSMLSDIRLGKSTEIDFINGYLLKLGQTFHVRMPATSTLLHLVKMRSAIPLDQQLSTRS